MSHSTHSDSGAGTFAVTTRALSKRYGGETALESVELRVPEGAVYVLIGPNGAGKSTTFKILMNLERPDSGSAEVFGLDTGRQGPKARAQVGYVPERQDSGNWAMTCGRLFQHVAAYYSSWDHAYAEQLTRALDLRLQRRVGGLSKGEARRLQLVMALAHRPPLLLLDEPTDGLDPLVRKRVLALLTEHLADTPTTVLISTHHVYEMETLADHVGVLRDGRLVAQLDRDELKRTVRRYRIEVPEGWESPPEFRVAADASRSPNRRELQWTLVGDERSVAEKLALTGARVREVTSLGLEDAALAFLDGEVTG